jgi:RNA polymerase sigma factor for flagellar operon FliA
MNKKKRDALITQWYPLVKWIGRKMSYQLPKYLHVDDLIGAGTFGLIDAIEKYEPEQGVHFKTYAQYRIRGAILDYIRSTDFLSRQARTRLKIYDKTLLELSQKLGRRPEIEEIRQALNFTDEEHIELAKGLELDLCFALINKDCKPLDVPDPSPRVDDLIGRYQIRPVLSQIIGTFPKRTQEILQLRYWEDKSFDEIGQVLGVTESRVCQITNHALIRIKRKLRSLGINTLAETPI